MPGPYPPTAPPNSPGNWALASSPGASDFLLMWQPGLAPTEARLLPFASTAGTVTIVNTGTGLIGGPINSTGTISLAIPVTVVDGGTGQIVYTDGQLLIGDSSTGGLDKATLTAGANVTITNGHGTITIAATPATDTYVGGLTALGSTQAGALGLTSNVNVVTTVATNTGVALPAGTLGLKCQVVNRGANPLKVYPVNGGSAQIETLGTNNPDTINPGGATTYRADSATLWYAT